MQIESMQIETLHLDPSNVRAHDEKNIDAIAASLARFGQQKPIVISHTNTVLAGNGTLSAAKKLGWGEIQAVRTSLKEAESIAYAIADNRTGELATWDDEALLRSLQALQSEDDALLEAAGFDESDLLELIGDITFEEQKPPEIQSEESDDLFSSDVPAITEPGDVVILGDHELFCGDCVDWMSRLPENSVDAVVTDPPYGIGFMQSAWDCDVPGDAFAKQALRILKPGGHLIAFGATRTIHRLTVALEDAGFEIRDQISWLTWQGFPKSHNISKSIDKAAGVVGDVVGSSKNFGASKASEGKVAFGDYAGSWDITEPKTKEAKRWKGWGSGLKPAQEPAVLCRKPLENSLSGNVLSWGTGGINIDACRISFGDPAWPGPNEKYERDEGRALGASTVGWGQSEAMNGFEMLPNDLGRFPANVYYCPKPSRHEREAGCGDLPQKSRGEDCLQYHEGKKRSDPEVHNYHPTCKPTRLMQWMLRLVVPPGGTVAEPFAGSGTTIMAAEREGFKCIAAEREPSYCDIIRARVVKTIEDDE